MNIETKMIRIQMILMITLKNMKDSFTDKEGREWTKEMCENLLKVLDLHTGLQISDDVQEHTLSLCLLALGAALRQDAVEAA